MRKSGPVILTILGWMRFHMLAVVAFFLVSSLSDAQVAPSQPSSDPQYVPSFTFDVASVRESPFSDSYMVRFDNPPHNSLVNFTNVDAENLLNIAYGVDRAQIVGLPAMPRGTLFNIRANSDASVDERLAKLDNKAALLEKQHMMQVLLADRFGLKVHWETKEGLVYNLVVAKSGSKMKPAGTIAPTAEEQKNWGENKIPVIYQRGNGIKGYEFVAHKCPMSSLMRILTGQMGAPVIDKTGLVETYDFVLQYKGGITGDAQDNPEAWPALDTAVPDQLGLRMQPGKGERKILVVDHFQRPSAN